MIKKLTPNIDSLSAESGKAELVHGKIQPMPPTGALPGIAAGRIYSSLDAYAEAQSFGHAFPDNVGFVVDLPHRQSFSPDAALFVGPVDMQFVQGAPFFAVEVRSDHDYGPAAEREIRQKRADYFAAGTAAVWDVDLYGEEVIRLYLKDAPETPVVFRRGELAHAEPAVPGWRMPVDSLYPKGWSF